MTLRPDELADRYFLAEDFVARQGKLVPWLYANNRQDEALKIIMAMGEFFLLWPGWMRNDLQYVYHANWSKKQREIESCQAQ